jgi:2-polyprenyl-3-methyl-5-hydroxy-6-metoxy-1,4-benzoquinol methylase
MRWHPDRPFDVIVMSHVIEHVPDPLHFLTHVRKMINKDGILYIATPNVVCWESRLDGWASYEPYHLIYFSPSTIKLALERSGFQALAVYTREPLSSWSNALLRSLWGGRYHRVRASILQEASGRFKFMYFLLLHY